MTWCSVFGLFCGSSHAASQSVPEINGGSFLLAVVVIYGVLAMWEGRRVR